MLFAAVGRPIVSFWGGGLGLFEIDAVFVGSRGVNGGLCCEIALQSARFVRLSRRAAVGELQSFSFLRFWGGAYGESRYVH